MLKPPPPACLIGATKSYGDVLALDAVDLSLEPGRVTAVLGPNGAGKTTAVQLLLGLKRPTAGRAELFGGPPSDLASRMRVGAMMQVSKVPETLRVREHLELFSSYYPKSIPLPELIEAAGLDGLENRHYGKLSGGQQQRLALAIALCGDPDLLFLDEPTVGMDVASRRLFWERIRKLADEGRTLLLTTHYLEEADSLADRVVVLQRGRIVADGTPESIKSRVMTRRVLCRTRVTLEEIRDLPGVDRVRQDRARFEIFTRTPERVVRELMNRDQALSDLEVGGAALEEAFLALTDDGTSPTPPRDAAISTGATA